MRKKGAFFVVVLLVLVLFGSVVGCAAPAPSTSSTPPPPTSSTPPPPTSSEPPPPTSSEPPPPTSSALPSTGWVQLSLGAATTYFLAIDPFSSQVLYAGTDGDGVFKTTDGGSIWSAASNGLTDSILLFLAIDPTNTQVIYAATTNKNVFKTTDGGSSWSDASSGLAGFSVWSLAIDPADPQVLYAGSDGYVFKTTNGGGDQNQQKWNASFELIQIPGSMKTERWLEQFRVEF